MNAIAVERSDGITDHKPPYYEFALGLFQPPFSLEPDNKFYFPTNALEQRLTVLRRLVMGQDDIILVIGDRGSGKTMLLNQFLEATGATWRRCTIKAYDKITSNRATALDQLNERKAFILREGQAPIVLMDDAHQLSEKELQHLLQNTVSPDASSNTKRLMLFGEPKLKTTLDSLSIDIAAKTPVNTIFMAPLTKDETAQYLHHRLIVAGLKGKSPFTASHVKKIHKASAGLPAHINTVALSILKAMYARGSWLTRLAQSMGGNNKNWMTAGLIGLAVILLLFSIFWGHRLFFSKPPVHKSDLTIGSAQRRPEKRQPVKRLKRSPRHFKRPISSIAYPPNDPEKKPLAKSALVNQPSTNQVTTQLPPSRIGLDTKIIFREDWLLNQSPDHYTVQILGVHEESALLAFVDTAKLPADLAIAYFQTNHQGSQWYPLLCGIYPDARKAQLAIQKWPPEIRQLSPWVRRMASVQSDIRKFKQ